MKIHENACGFLHYAQAHKYVQLTHGSFTSWTKYKMILICEQCWQACHIILRMWMKYRISDNLCIGKFCRISLKMGIVNFGVFFKLPYSLWKCILYNTIFVKKDQSLNLIHCFCLIRGRPFDSEGGGGGWYFLEINILTLKMLEISNLSFSRKKINNLTLTC